MQAAETIAGDRPRFNIISTDLQRTHQPRPTTVHNRLVTTEWQPHRQPFISIHAVATTDRIKTHKYAYAHQVGPPDRSTYGDERRYIVSSPPHIIRIMDVFYNKNKYIV